MDDPSQKVLHRQVQRIFFCKLRKLRGRLRRKKRKAVISFYSKFVTELKQTDQGAWYRMGKRIDVKDIVVEEIKGLSNTESADKIAKHFAAVSSSYSPLNII